MNVLVVLVLHTGHLYSALVFLALPMQHGRRQEGESRREVWGVWANLPPKKSKGSGGARPKIFKLLTPKWRGLTLLEHLISYIETF